MNIALHIDDLNTRPQLVSSARRWSFAYWIFFIGVLSGVAALALLTAAVTQ
jgi:hypothetical protein